MVLIYLFRRRNVQFIKNKHNSAQMSQFYTGIWTQLTFVDRRLFEMENNLICEAKLCP